uniref:Uncharacterized protein n=1 Tax=Arundo donax TaxID=35708 RepID=A0A0A8ZAQ2_ARUDO
MISLVLPTPCSDLMAPEYY